jgi:hypothetical protein
MSLEERVKTIVLCIARTELKGAINLTHLEKRFRDIEGRYLRDIALKLGFYRASELISSWDEFTVSGNGLATVVQAKKLDHITMLNQRSK